MKTERKKVLVIGGAASLGRYLVGAHLSLGDTVVSTSRSLDDLTLHKSSNYRRVQYDLLSSTNITELLKLSYDFDGFDLVYCVAAAVPSQCQDANTFLQTNVAGYERILSELELSQNAFLVHMSSMSCYKPVPGLITSGSARNIDEPYAASKNLMSVIINEIAEQKNVRSTSLIIPALLSIGNQNNFFFNWTKAAYTKDTINVFNPDADFNACIDAQAIFEIAEAAYYSKTFKGTEIFLGSELTTLRSTFNALVKLGFFEDSQLQITQIQRPSTLLSTKQMKKLGIVSPSVTDMLAREITQYMQIVQNH